VTPLFLGLTYVLLNAIDIGLTLVVLGMGGQEVNPAVVWFGWPAFLAVKAITSVGVGALAYWKNGRPAVYVFVFMMAGVCIWNGWQLGIAMGR